MIPRTKANYSFIDLIRAVFIAENNGHKLRLKTLLGKYFDTQNIILTPSGRSGLYFILRSLKQSRVIVPAYTCNAVVEAAMLAGKEVTYVDIEKDGFNMDPEQLSGLVNEESIVVATHQFGIPCDIRRIMEICRAHGALVVEDAAASFGTRVNGQLTGTFGDAAFFSFDSTKLINVPMKGGFIIAKDDALYKRINEIYENEIRPMPIMLKIRLLILASFLLIIENHLLYKLFHLFNFELRGTFTAESPELDLTLTPYYRYDLADWQACIAAKQVSCIEKLINRRRELYNNYRKRLASCRLFSLPPNDDTGEWACIRFPIRVVGDKVQYYKKATKGGVDFAFSFTFIAAPDNFYQSHLLAKRVLDIPFYAKLRNEELENVIRAFENLEKQGG